MTETVAIALITGGIGIIAGIISGIFSWMISNRSIKHDVEKRKLDIEEQNQKEIAQTISQIKVIISNLRYLYPQAIKNGFDHYRYHFADEIYRNLNIEEKELLAKATKPEQRAVHEECIRQRDIGIERNRNLKDETSERDKVLIRDISNAIDNLISAMSMLSFLSDTDLFEEEKKVSELKNVALLPSALEIKAKMDKIKDVDELNNFTAQHVNETLATVKRSFDIALEPILKKISEVKVY